MKCLIRLNFFSDKIEHDYNKCIRIRINNDEKYIDKYFETYCLKRNIRREFIIVENSQINNYTKRLNQKNSNINIKY